VGVTVTLEPSEQLATQVSPSSSQVKPASHEPPLSEYTPAIVAHVDSVCDPPPPVGLEPPQPVNQAADKTTQTPIARKTRSMGIWIPESSRELNQKATRIPKSWPTWAWSPHASSLTRELDALAHTNAQTRSPLSLELRRELRRIGGCAPEFGEASLRTLAGTHAPHLTMVGSSMSKHAGAPLTQRSALYQKVGV
jgi:hypothetical protein